MIYITKFLYRFRSQPNKPSKWQKYNKEGESKA